MRKAATAALLVLAFCPAAWAALPRTVTDGAWTRVESPNFVFLSNLDPSRVEKLARDLERLNEVLARTTKGLESRSPLGTCVIVFDSPRSLEPYNLARPRGSAHVLGYYSAPGHAQYIALAPPSEGRIEPILYHEFLHSFQHANFASLPRWLDEGVAEFYSTFAAGRDEADVGLADEDHVRWLRGHELRPLAALFAAGPEGLGGGEAEQTFYSQSWALAHMLIEAPGEGEARLSTYLNLLVQGWNPARALGAAYGSQAEDSLATALHLYLGRGRFAYQRYRFTDELVRAEVRARPLPRTELLARLGDLLLSHHEPRVGEAREHFAAALAADSLHAAALTGMGRCADLDGRHEEADAWFARAMAADESDAASAYFAGASLVRRHFAAAGGAGDGPPPEPLRRARTLLARSLQLSLAQPEALLAYGRTFLHEWGDSARAGLGAVQTALSLYLPPRADAVVDQVMLEANAGRREAARALVERTLIPMGDDDAIRLARQAIFRADAHRAGELLRQGRAAEAESLVELAHAQAEDEDLRRKAGSMLEDMRRERAAGEWVDRYNQGIAALNAGRFEEALPLFEQVAAGTSDAALRREAEARRVDTRVALGVKRAAALAGDGDLPGARAVLDELLQLPLSETRRAEIRRMRAEVTAAPPAARR